MPRPSSKRRIVDSGTKESGIANLGRTCWMGSILQAFVHIPEFSEQISSIDLDSLKRRLSPPSSSSHEQLTANSSKRITRRAAADELLACSSSIFFELVQLVNEISGRTKAVVDPRGFHRAFFQRNSDFEDDVDQDAHEFYLSLLESLHVGEEQIAGSMVSSLFQGQMESETKCGFCGSMRSQSQPFYSISLGFPTDLVEKASAMNVRTQINVHVKILDLLDQFCAAHELESPCMVCSGFRETRIRLNQLPTILCVHIKRFMFVRQNGKVKKIRFTLKFDHFLNLEPFASPNPQTSTPETPNQFVYQLQSVILHTGQSLSNGHYHSLCRLSADSDKFCDYDDKWEDAFKEVKEPLEGQAYILFYTRCRN